MGTNGGPTEMTVGIPVKVAVLELPGLKLDFNPGAATQTPTPNFEPTEAPDV